MPLGKIIRSLAHWFGTPIRDVETGAILGRAFIVAWGGRVHLLGFDGKTPLRPVVVPREKLEYWRVSLGFTAAREPDYPNHAALEPGPDTPP